MNYLKMTDRRGLGCFFPVPASELLVSCSYFSSGTDSEKKENRERRKKEKNDPDSNRIAANITIIIHIPNFFLVFADRKRRRLPERDLFVEGDG